MTQPVVVEQQQRDGGQTERVGQPVQRAPEGVVGGRSIPAHRRHLPPAPVPIPDTKTHAS